MSDRKIDAVVRTYSWRQIDLIWARALNAAAVNLALEFR